VILVAFLCNDNENANSHVFALACVLYWSDELPRRLMEPAHTYLLRQLLRARHSEQRAGPDQSRKSSESTRSTASTTIFLELWPQQRLRQRLRWYVYLIDIYYS
jgi:hypothetical protein